jgi:hypothetical protein
MSASPLSISSNPLSFSISHPPAISKPVSCKLRIKVFLLLRGISLGGSQPIKIKQRQEFDRH